MYWGGCTFACPGSTVVEESCGCRDRAEASRHLLQLSNMVSREHHKNKKYSSDNEHEFHYRQGELRGRVPPVADNISATEELIDKQDTLNKNIADDTRSKIGPLTLKDLGQPTSSQVPVDHSRYFNVPEVFLLFDLSEVLLKTEDRGGNKDINPAILLFLQKAIRKGYPKYVPSEGDGDNHDGLRKQEKKGKQLYFVDKAVSVIAEEIDSVICKYRVYEQQADLTKYSKQTITFCRLEYYTDSFSYDGDFIVDPELFSGEFPEKGEDLILKTREDPGLLPTAREDVDDVCSSGDPSQEPHPPRGDDRRPEEGHTAQFSIADKSTVPDKKRSFGSLDEAEQIDRPEISAEPKSRAAMPTFSFCPDPAGRVTAAERAESQAIPDTQSEPLHEPHQERIFSDVTPEQQISDLDAICADLLTDQHHRTDPKAFVQVGQVGTQLSERPPETAESDLRTDGQSESSSGLTPEAVVEAPNQAPPETKQSDTAQSYTSQDSSCSMLPEAVLLSDLDSLSPTGSLVRVHTPVAVSSPTSSGPVCHDYGDPAMLSGSFSGLRPLSVTVTESLSQHPPAERQPVLRHVQSETGSDTGASHRGEPGCAWPVRCTSPAQAEDSGFMQASPDCAGPTAHRQGTEGRELSCPQAQEEGSECSLAHSARCAHPSSQASPAHFPSTDTDSSSVWYVDEARGRNDQDGSASASLPPVRDDSGSSTPVRLPPITVHAAGSLPPWVAQTSLIDLSRAANRQFAPLRRRRGTYDEDWPNTSGIDAANMALAGFYHVGPDRHVRCFYCGLELDYLTSAHNIWDEHVRHCPTCPYLRAVMGEDMVQETQMALDKQNQ